VCDTDANAQIVEGVEWCSSCRYRYDDERAEVSYDEVKLQSEKSEWNHRSAFYTAQVSTKTQPWVKVGVTPQELSDKVNLVNSNWLKQVLLISHFNLIGWLIDRIR
jgi:hypothetical protein